MPETKRACWRAKEGFLKCLAKSTCYKETRSFEDCLLDDSCYLARKNWVICKMNSANPKYRNRGNPYDIMTEDQRKVQDRVERLRQRIAEEDGEVIDGDEFHES